MIRGNIVVFNILNANNLQTTITRVAKTKLLNFSILQMASAKF